MSRTEAEAILFPVTTVKFIPRRERVFPKVLEADVARTKATIRQMLYQTRAYRRMKDTIGK